MPASRHWCLSGDSEGATHGLGSVVGGVKAGAGGGAPGSLGHGDSTNGGNNHRLGGAVEGGLHGAGAGGLLWGGRPRSLALAEPACAHSGAGSAVRAQA